MKGIKIKTTFAAKLIAFLAIILMLSWFIPANLVFAEEGNGSPPGTEQSTTGGNTPPTETTQPTDTTPPTETTQPTDTTPPDRNYSTTRTPQHR